MKSKIKTRTKIKRFVAFVEQKTKEEVLQEHQERQQRESVMHAPSIDEPTTTQAPTDKDVQ